MKSLFSVLALTVMIAGCSSSSSNDEKNLSPFQKLAGGQWLSACQRDNKGPYKETLVLNGSNGSSTYNYYNTTDCSGAVVRTDGPNNFTYTSTPKTGGKDGEANVTIQFPGRPAATVEVIVQENTLVLVGENGPVIYQRQGELTKPGTGNGGTGAQAFDAAARGNWMTRDCAQIQNGGGSYLQILTISGNGRAATQYNVYPSLDCTGQPNPQQRQELNYVVNRYANGGGELSINNNAIVDVSIQGRQMTLSGAAGTQVFVRIN